MHSKLRLRTRRNKSRFPGSPNAKPLLLKNLEPNPETTFYDREIAFLSYSPGTWQPGVLLSLRRHYYISDSQLSNL